MSKPVALGSLLLLTLTAFLVGRYSSKPTPAAHASSKPILYYVDPMHPAYRSPKPGIAPDCGMALVPVYGEETVATEGELPSGSLFLNRDKQELMGLRAFRVQSKPGSYMVHTTGRLEAQDNRVYRLTASTEGWVQALQENSVGSVVKKDEVLASFYSREFRNAQQAYLGALSSSERVKNGGAPDDPNSVLKTNEEQLRAMGMGEPQIKDLAKKRQTTRDISVVSPIDGIVLARNISPEQRFEKGTELYRIADLSKMWIVADIFDWQTRGLRPGSKVKVTVPGLSKTLVATVTKNPPVFDPSSRTMKLRLETGNPGMTLRPDMFVDLEFRAEEATGISVPAEAILDSGLRKIVYLQTSENVFEPRQVEVGKAYGNQVMIEQGLSSGDRVVSSGTFLLDSESRLRKNTLHAIPSLQLTGKPDTSERRKDEERHARH
jgi:membrane fusion protein, copper/silver efflux system